MKYVFLYGGLWEVPSEKFKWLLEAIIEGKEFYMPNYGVLLTEQIDADVSTMNPEQARTVLDRYK